ncbi:MAG TPA: CoA-binding protein, partial [Bacteroidia bacterium]|nr:CoA-binding protein [Bacteroidia bacterium]
MVISQLIQPKSIAVIGASDNITKPGGMVLQNLIHGKFEGKLFAVNPKPVSFKEVTYVSNLNNLEAVDLAIIAIPASQCLETVRALLK